MDEPTEFLTEPPPPDASISNGFVNPIDAFNYVSPSAWIAKAIESLCGVDPIAWACECLAGDWQALYRFGDAMGNLAQCLQQLGINIQEGMLTLDESWDGNANDAAYRYFSDLAAAISSQQIPLYNSEESYHLAATGAWQLANQLGNVVQAIADEAVIAAMTAAAGTATAYTGIGAVAGYGATALIVINMLKKINMASQKIQCLWNRRPRHVRGSHRRRRASRSSVRRAVTECRLLRPGGLTVSDDDALDHELERVAGSPGLAKAVKEQIIKLHDGAGGPELAEMADDLLSGRTDLRSVATSGAYSEQLTEAATTFGNWYAELSPEEREQLIADAQALVAAQGEDPAGQSM